MSEEECRHTYRARRLLRDRADAAGAAARPDGRAIPPLNREYSSADAPGRTRADRGRCSHENRLMVDQTSPPSRRDCSGDRLRAQAARHDDRGHAARAHQAQPRDRRARSALPPHAGAHRPELRLRAERRSSSASCEIRKPDYFLRAAGADRGAHDRARSSSRPTRSSRRSGRTPSLFYGDTNSCLAAIAAKRRRIPIFHLEAGNRCFDQRVPEEINRKIIDHISDINMPLTEQARHYLLAEGLRPETVIKIGSTMREVLDGTTGRASSARTSLERLELTPQRVLRRQRAPRRERRRPASGSPAARRAAGRSRAATTGGS